MDNAFQDHLDTLLINCNEKYRTIIIKVVGYHGRYIDAVGQTVQKCVQYIREKAWSSLDKLCVWSEDEEYLLAVTSAVRDINTHLESLPVQPHWSEKGSRNNQEVYSSKLLVTSLHEETTETELDNFLHELTEYRLVKGSMVFHASTPDIAMVTFETEIDYMRFLADCGSHTLNGITPQFSRISMSNCVIVSHMSELIDESMVHSYFDGEKYRVQSVGKLPGIRCCLVTLMDYKDADNILARKHCINGCDVTVKRYFSCIERAEPENIFCTRENNLTFCLSIGDCKELQYDRIEKGMVVTHENSVNIHAAMEYNDSFYEMVDALMLADLCGYKSVVININDNFSSKSLPFFNWRRSTKTLDKIYFCSRQTSDLKMIETLMRYERFSWPTEKSKMPTTLDQSAYPWLIEKSTMTLTVDPSEPIELKLEPNELKLETLQGNARRYTYEPIELKLEPNELKLETLQGNAGRYTYNPNELKLEWLQGNARPYTYKPMESEKSRGKVSRYKNKDKHVECQLLLPTEQELYVSGRGIIDTNCMEIARRQEFE
ncbi:hypothetical protein DPMN_119614 [Dreissena polymorpha]|uniref:Uncharacterized protein n=1 Tax=Dreissena polymorpha TaxID=45954 RepID=A0A9D4GQ88_DREPO|nr:hypothetical protein DPMN_119614 [Dreissena polymorpha]